MRFALPLLLLLLPVLLGADSPPATEPEATDERMLELEAREAALRVLEEDLARRIEELRELREAAIAAILPQERERAAQLETLISFYQAMKPKQAAKLLEKLPSSLAADVLSAMKSRSAGKILDVMSAERAVVISKLMAGRN
ncbi:MAG: MotE family protein [Myxococcota bacterium]